jgi:hypothetical protein
MTLNFPVLAFSQDLVSSIPHIGVLTISTTVALRSGYYEQLNLVDRVGNVAGVARVEKVRALPLRSFGDIMEFLGGNRKCEVALEFETRPSTSLSGAKQLIFNSFEKERAISGTK